MYKLARGRCNLKSFGIFVDRDKYKLTFDRVWVGRSKQMRKPISRGFLAITLFIVNDLREHE